MMRLIILLILTLVGGRQTTAGEVDTPLWPLDLETRYLTGNFMEPRGGRFHTGLDMKTNSRTGYAVRAVQDGWISRIKFTPNGYGKSLSLTGDDGLTYVYGHLGRLNDELRVKMRGQQERRGRYSVAIYPGRDEIRVRRGDVLALSGQSGTSGPHLHFEVRGPDGQPRDPQAFGFAVADTLAPEILAVRALGPGRSCRRVGDGKKLLDGSLPDLQMAADSLRFSVRVVERSDHLRYRLGPWKLTMLVDGQVVFSTRNDSLDWSRNRQQRLEYLATELGAERCLYGDPQVNLEGRWSEAWLDAGSWEPGIHQVRLIAEDRAGNRSEVNWSLLALEAGFSEPGGWPEAEHPWAISLKVATGTQPSGVQMAGELPVLWWSGPLLKPLNKRIMKLSGLNVLAAPVQFQPDGWAVLDPVPVSLPPVALPAEALLQDPAVALYRLSKRSWALESGLEARANGYGFKLGGPGVFVVCRDEAAPLIATASVDRRLVRRPARQQNGITMPRWTVLKVPVGDHGSGVDWGRLEVFLNGQSLLVEPDPPRDRILVEFPDDLEAGDHRLEVQVFDQAGNGARAALLLNGVAETGGGAAEGP